MCRLLIISLALLTWAPDARAQNRVLSLPGRDAYVELPTNLFLDFEQATVEAWVKWDDFRFYSQWFAFGSGEDFQAMGLNQHSWFRTPQFFIYDRDRTVHVAKVAANLPLNDWVHMAAVSGPGGMRLYLNGVLAAQDDFDGSFAAMGNGEVSYLGRSNWADNFDFMGALDEVRVWSTARSGEQIVETMHQALRGDEPGLAALWNFDGPCSQSSTVRDESGHGHHGVLQGRARCDAEALPARLTPPNRLHGTVTDAMGVPQALAIVELFEEGKLTATTATDGAGAFEMRVFGAGPFDLNARRDEQSSWQTGLTLAPYVSTQIDPILRRAAGLQGRIQGRDGKARRGLVVEAVPVTGSEARTRVAMTDANGWYRFWNLRPGSYRIRIHLRDRFAWLTSQGLSFFAADAQPYATKDRRPVALPTVRLTPQRGGTWRTFGAFEGLKANEITDIDSDPDGRLWVTTAGSGVWSFDGEHFTNLTTAEGLAHDEVSHVALSRDGSVWFSTKAGASRWHQGRFTTLTTAHGLPLDEVSAVLEDQDGRLWIGTLAGIALVIDGEVRADPIIDAALSRAPVSDLLQDAEGGVWIGTDGRGVWNYVDGKMTPYNLREGMADTRVWSITQTGDGAIWFGTDNGISQFAGGRFHTWFTATEGFISSQFFAVYAAADGTVWSGASGLGVLRTNGEQFIHYTVEDGLAHNKVTAIHQDFQGGLWIGSEDGSLTRLDESGILNLGNAQGLAADRILDVEQDNDGDLWVGTDRGLRVLRDDAFELIGQDDGLAQEISALAMAPDRLWIGCFKGSEMLTNRGGLWAYDGSVTRHSTGADQGPFQDIVNALFLDRDSVLWVGTRGGVLRRDVGLSRSEPGLPPDLNRDVMSISQDGAGHLIFGTDGHGIYVYDGDTLQHVGAAEGLVDDRVTAMHRDGSGILWIGTQDGLSRVVGDRFVNYTTREGLPHGHIGDIVTDTRGRHWVGTHGGGLAVYDGISWSAVDSRDGLADNRINALALAEDGDLWLGTESGLTRYRPDAEPPRVRFTGVRIDTLSMAPADLTEVETGTHLRVELAATDFGTLPTKRQYRYRVVEQDTVWRSVTGVGHLEWTPQKPGRFHLEVQALDRSLNASTPIRLPLTVVLPWYRDLRYAGPLWSVVVLAIAAIALLARRAISLRRETQRMRQQMLDQEHAAHAELEARNAELDTARRESELARGHAESAADEARRAAAAAEEANRAKSAFLANMSHELRTPLNAILGFGQLLERSDEVSEGQRENVRIIGRSGEHLLALINDVLEMSRIEAGRTELEEEAFDLHELIASVVDMFRLRAQEKGLSLAADVAPDVPRAVRADEGKLRQILINLLSNAVKFTDNGEISVVVAPKGGRTRLAVQDTGAGIAADEQETLFEPFVQTQTGRQEGKGTGLGLAISRQFARLMGGDLTIDSVAGSGSIFRVDIPLTEAAPGDIAERVTSRRVVGLASGQPSYRILVVEDGEDNRNLLRQLLEPLGYGVRDAVDGEQGIDLFEAWSPHLIIMDMRMPVLDGFEATRRIKSTTAGQETKIIALTASAFEEDRIEVMAAGCDDFVRKPFEEADLLERIRRQLSAEYEYAGEEPASTSASATRASTTDTPLASLPADLRRQIHDAANVANEDKLTELVAELRADHAEDAVRLESLVRDFAFDQLVRLTED